MSTKTIIILSIILIPIAITILYYVIRFIFDFLYFLGKYNLALIPVGFITSLYLNYVIKMPNIYFSIGTTLLCVIGSILIWAFGVKKLYDLFDTIKVVGISHSCIGKKIRQMKLNKKNHVSVSQNYYTSTVPSNENISSYSASDFLV